MGIHKPRRIMTKLCGASVCLHMRVCVCAEEKQQTGITVPDAAP
jgi:hypothetical protein